MMPKYMKYLRINMTKDVHDLYSENFKILLKLRKTQINIETQCVHGSEDMILGRYRLLPNWTINSAPIQPKFPQAFCRNEHADANIHMEMQKT